jgi:hypothetical protein
MSTLASRGQSIQAKLFQAIANIRNGTGLGRARPVIWGVSLNGQLVGGLTMPAFLASAGRYLRESERVYRYSNTTVYETRIGEERGLAPLALAMKAEPNAPVVLNNIFSVGVQGDKEDSFSVVPSRLAGAILSDEDVAKSLPIIRYYMRRPVFDAAFNWSGQGWHPTSGVLVHGPEVTPILPADPLPQGSVIDRLPPRTGELLREFSWRGNADLVNAVGVMLTGLLINHFVDQPHPMVLLDGNQPQLGKTLFAQCLGRLFDDQEPARLPLVQDDELEKKLCSQLRSARSTLFLFDNARGKIESALIEANALAPLISIRILGHNTNMERPNLYLWVITSNSTSATEDLISRGLPIRLYYEGDPRLRAFQRNPLEHVNRWRLDILGELAGMVQRWKERGMPMGNSRHRCQHWARVISGILEVAGLQDFLANVAEAEAEMDEGMQTLANLAAHVVAKSMGAFFCHAGTASGSVGRRPGEWAPVIQAVTGGPQPFADRQGHGRDTKVGQFLSGKVGRTVEVATASQIGGATLCVRKGRANQKHYHFEITFSADNNDPMQPPTGPSVNTSVHAGENPSRNPTTSTEGDPYTTAEGDQQPASTARGDSGPLLPPAPGDASPPPPRSVAVAEDSGGNELQWV